MRPPRRPYDLVKRGIDVVAGIIGLVVTLPVQALVAVLVWRRLGRPVLFRQRRAGKLGRPFELVKFRTMLPINVEQGAIADEERITRLGTFLRSTSLDELPT
ncbi:MAG: Undecaprenyl-phosphate galactose phosphotransferase, partial [Cryobacterium sp.]|nr:Undecaprenyl-phosphate galactose phosphotransferase [Cryobacterium sp.]